MISLYTYLLLLFIVLGAIFGSFFNVLIYRLPAGVSVVHPPSRCPKCGHQITWYENIPILSWIFLGAKCSGCKTHISIQYPLIEALTALYSGALLHFLVFPALPALIDAPFYSYFPIAMMYISALLFIPIALIDIRHLIIPDSLTIGGSVIAAALLFIPGGLTPLEGLYGALVGGGTLYGMGVLGKLVLKKEAMGMGDVKMLLWFGLLFGPAIAFGTIFIGALLGLLGTLVLSLFHKYKEGSEIPFGPYLCGGAIISLFWGPQLWQWYGLIIGVQ